MFAKKIETYTISEFLAGNHKKCKSQIKPTLPLYGIMGIDITPHSMFSNFNGPYIVVFAVTGVVLLSAAIEYTLVANGHERAAEVIENITGFIMPIAFYIFLAIGLFNVL